MFLKNLLLGIIIGIGFIVPGVSGGVLATILGIYDEIISKLNNLFKDFKNNLYYLTPIFIGIFISILLLSKLILYLLNNHHLFISYVFIGLILGCIPYLFQTIKIKTNKFLSFPSFLIALFLGIMLYLIEKNTFIPKGTPNFFTMLFAGFLYAFGKIVPGISGAALFMLIGIYEFFLGIIANPLDINFTIIKILIPFLISFLLSAIIILKLIAYFLNNHFLLTYSAIIGFVISSILFIYPGIFTFKSLIIALLSFLISYNVCCK